MNNEKYNELVKNTMELVKVGIITKDQLENNFKNIESKLEKYKNDSDIDKMKYAEWEDLTMVIDEVLFKLESL